MDNRHLGRKETPLSDATWDLLDRIMVGTAKSQLSGRKLLDVEGPYGFGLKAIPAGDVDIEEGIVGSSSIPITLIQSGFRIRKRDLAAYDRDGIMPDMRAIVDAVSDMAAKEDRLIFSGLPGTRGLLTGESCSMNLGDWSKTGDSAEQVIAAVTRLDDAGFHGPYVLGLSPAQYNLLLRRYPQGEGTELDHIKTITGAGVIKTPAIKKGGVLLASGPQYAAIVLGQDMNIEFNGPAGDSYDFLISESLALVIRSPGAVCVLK
jgi:uncharacterized linocin/CFP29 family protein